MIEFVETKAAPDRADQQVNEAISRSVVVNLPPYWGARWWGIGDYASALPGVDNPARAAYLNQLRYHPQNILTSIAANALISQFIGATWEIKGKRRAKHYQNVLMNADRGRGWSALWQRVWWDYFTLDDGAVIEVIGPGAPDTYLPRELIVGVGYLDSLRCHFTDNYDHPVWYQDWHGAMHKLHHSRVIRLVDMPLPSQGAGGRGFSALSRSIAAVQQSITMMTYTGEMLANEPPPGLMRVGNVVSAQQFEQSYSEYMARRREAGNTVYKPVWMHINPGAMGKADVDFTRFSQAPEGYDFEAYIRLQAQLVASAWGLDPQDILPLIGGSFGTNTEAEILDRKSRGKTLALMFKLVEREFNRSVLPDALEMRFANRDDEQSAREAETALVQLQIAEKLMTIGAPSDAVLRYAANTVPAFRDVLLDEAGQLRLYDADPIEVAEPAVLDDTQGETDTEAAPLPEDEKSFALASKSFDRLKFEFGTRYRDALDGLNDGDTDRRRGGVILRGLLATYGRRAYLQGLQDGGVDTNVFSIRDQRRYEGWVKDQSEYVSGLTARLVGDGETSRQLYNTVGKWVNKSLYDAYLLGLEMADGDGIYEWFLGPTEQHCTDCSRLNGQRHRLDAWIRTGWKPGGDRLECKGYNCECRLRRSTRGERGGF
jgi:hypothetical protein